jgi:N4-gp56 family major capsid protein
MPLSSPAVGATQSTIGLAQAAYDRAARFALRPELYFDNVADVKPTNQSMPGSSVTFPIISDLPIASAPLNEITDVTPQSISESNVTVNLAEYGNAVLTTAPLRGESYVEIDPIVANVVGYNAGVSIDEVARDVLEQGTNVQYGSKGYAGTAVTTRAGIVNSVSSGTYQTLHAADVRGAKAFLRSNNVPNFNGFYTAYIHPNTAYDFTSETGSATWRDPHTYSQPGEIWAGELGAFEGVRFIETPRAPRFAGAGGGGSSLTLTNSSGGTIPVAATTAYFTATTTTLNDPSNPQIGDVVTTTGTFTGTVTTATVTAVSIPSLTANASSVTLSLAVLTTGTVTLSKGGADVYGTLFLGRQSLAKAWSMVDGNTEQPHVVPGPITDYLRRFVPWGWYWLGGYSIYRQASVYRIETISTLTTTDPAIDA